MEKIIKTAKRDDGIPRTAQQTIPFERMFADGTCRVRDGYYTRTIQFQDINYQLAPAGGQDRYFRGVVQLSQLL